MARDTLALSKKIGEFCDKYPIMNELSNERVISVTQSNRDKSKVRVAEGYDDYYGLELSKDEVRQVGEFFTELSKYMK